MKYLITAGTLIGMWLVAATLFYDLPRRYLLPASGIGNVLGVTAGALLTYLTTATVAEWMKVKRWKYYPN